MKNKPTNSHISKPIPPKKGNVAVATIDDLVKSITDCSQEELLERLRVIRLSRRTSKSPPKRSKTPSVKKKEVSLDAILSNPALAKQLLDALKEGDDE